MVGSTRIDGPTLNRRNHHQGVILDVPQHRRCIIRPLGRAGRTSRYSCTYAMVNQANPSWELTCNRQRISDQGRPSP
jgi:hypothetical protein